MILKEGTYLQTHEICNLYNNISGLKEGLEDDGYEYIDDILNDLEFAYNNNKEDYLMNLLLEEAMKEAISISQNYNILTNSYPFGKYKKIGAEKYAF